MTQKQRFAIFGIREPAYTMSLSLLYPHRNQIFPGGQRRETCRLSPELYRTIQYSVHAIVQNMYVHRPPLVYDEGWKGKDDEVTAPYSGATG